MAMQSNCNGSSWGPRAKRTMRVAGRGGREESRDKTNFVLLKFSNLPPRKEKMWGTKLPRRESMDRLRLIPTKVNTTRNRFSVRSMFCDPSLWCRTIIIRLILIDVYKLRNISTWSWLAHNLEPQHCLTQPKVGEQSAFPSLTTASFAATGDFPFPDGKTHCDLNHGT